jgi:hypothetical protein
MKIPVIILYDRVFEQYRVYYRSGAHVNLKTFEEAQSFIQSQVDLREVYVNSKPGRKILKGIGNAHGDGCPF